MRAPIRLTAALALALGVSGWCALHAQEKDPPPQEGPSYRNNFV